MAVLLGGGCLEGNGFIQGRYIKAARAIAKRAPADASFPKEEAPPGGERGFLVPLGGTGWGDSEIPIMSGTDAQISRTVMAAVFQTVAQCV
jgi:hypothetical protein